jgi:hypothetical protein
MHVECDMREAALLETLDQACHDWHNDLVIAAEKCPAGEKCPAHHGPHPDAWKEARGMIDDTSSSTRQGNKILRELQALREVAVIIDRRMVWNRDLTPDEEREWAAQMVGALKAAEDVRKGSI